eukprot:scaffold233890_cov18-Tisochrysis_lutea.AAC.1
MPMMAQCKTNAYDVMTVLMDYARGLFGCVARVALMVQCSTRADAVPRKRWSFARPDLQGQGPGQIKQGMGNSVENRRSNWDRTLLTTSGTLRGMT